MGGPMCPVTTARTECSRMNRTMFAWWEPSELAVSWEMSQRTSTGSQETMVPRAMVARATVWALPHPAPTSSPLRLTAMTRAGSASGVLGVAVCSMSPSSRPRAATATGAPQGVHLLHGRTCAGWNGARDPAPDSCEPWTLGAARAEQGVPGGSPSDDPPGRIRGVTDGGRPLRGVSMES